jgi:tungstate transport system ATP-binding protein
MVGSILPLCLRDAQVIKRGKLILGPLTFDLKGKGLTTLLGPNGSGKTTFLRAIHGLERLRHGTIEWARPDLEARRLQAFVFQSPIILRRSVIDNIAYPLLIAGIEKRRAQMRAADMAATLGLQDLLGVPAIAISGGEKQKLSLARALISEPQVLVLDEPCANLDGTATKEIETILQAQREKGTRIIMSTHNVAQARRLADDVLFLYEGLLHDQGPAGSFFTTPKTAEALAFISGEILP